MNNEQFQKINDKVSTMSLFLESYSDVLQEQITELAKFANKLDHVSKELQQVTELMKTLQKDIKKSPAPYLGP